MTKGDQIVIPYDNNEYKINIVSCEPREAISLTNVDVKADFLPALDAIDAKNDTKNKSNEVNEVKEIEQINESIRKGKLVRIDGEVITEEMKKSMVRVKLNLV